jgi:hypothetical protein
MPDHDISTGFTSRPCEVPWYFEIPLNPTVVGGNATSLGEGVIGAGINGVPLWSARSKTGGNVVTHDDVSAILKYRNYLNAEAGSSGTTDRCQWRYTAIGEKNNMTNVTTGERIQRSN